MNKYFTLFCFVESKYHSKQFFYNSIYEMLKDTYKKSADLLDSVKLSPPKEVINKILEHVNN